jgi:hypothetical protein
LLPESVRTARDASRANQVVKDEFALFGQLMVISSAVAFADAV